MILSFFNHHYAYLRNKMPVHMLCSSAQGSSDVYSTGSEEVYMKPMDSSSDMNVLSILRLPPTVNLLVC